MNKCRKILQIVSEIADEESLSVSQHCTDWIIKLYNEKSIHYIYGYNFDINNSASAMLACDKSATYEILNGNQIPCVEHELFLCPSQSIYVSEFGNWEPAIALSKKMKFPLICKPNQGTGGSDVRKIKNHRELEIAFQDLHQHHRSICISPYYEIEAEYRAIILNDSVLLCYKKELPMIFSDGEKTYGELFIEHLKTNGIDSTRVTRSFAELPFSVQEVPPKGFHAISWKHNLGLGSKPIEIGDTDMIDRIQDLAKRTMSACSLNFASVDIILTKGNELKVLEVNSGIMLENYILLVNNGYEKAKQIYKSAIQYMFRN